MGGNTGLLSRTFTISMPSQKRLTNEQARTATFRVLQTGKPSQRALWPAVHGANFMSDSMVDNILDEINRGRRPFKVVAYGAHIGIVDRNGCSIASIVDQGSLSETLRVARMLIDGGR